MPYIPYEYETYRLLPRSRKEGGEVFEYPCELLDQVNSILPEGEDLIPYGYDSIISYCTEMEKWLHHFAEDKEKYDLINRYYYKVVIQTFPEAWAVVKYVGESVDEGIGLTKGQFYYCPRPANDRETFGVIDDAEFTSYMYSCDPSLWVLYEDPTGEASITLGQKPRVNRMCRCCGKHYFFYEGEEFCPICGWKHFYQNRKILQSVGTKDILKAGQHSILKANVDMDTIVHSAFENLQPELLDYVCQEYVITKEELFAMTERQLDCVYNTLNRFLDFEEYANGRGSERYKILLSIIRSIQEYYQNTLWVHLWKQSKFTLFDATLAHKYCRNNKLELETNSKCGCFYCTEIFDSGEITEWLIEDNPADKHGTALCPKCGIDSVISEGAGYPMTEDFLDIMDSIWFADCKEDTPRLLINHKCPVCGKFDFDKWNSLEICDNCGWQNDGFQADNPDEERGTNQMSLNQAKIAYANGEDIL